MDSGYNGENMNQDEIQNLHARAENLREQEKFTEALSAYNTVKDFYQKTGNFSGLVEAMGGECLTYKHLYLVSGDKKYLITAKNLASSGLDIANLHKLDKLIYRINFWLGEMETISENYVVAIEYYEKALRLYPLDSAEKGDFQYHLGVAQYKNGQRELGMKNILEGIKLIEKNEAKTDLFLIHVWLTGAYKVLVSILWNDNRGEAQKYLDLAEEIIRSDDRLIIRKRQLQELRERLLND